MSEKENLSETDQDLEEIIEQKIDQELRKDKNTDFESEEKSSTEKRGSDRFKNKKGILKDQESGKKISRRNFLKKTGLAIAGFTALGSSPSLALKITNNDVLKDGNSVLGGNTGIITNYSSDPSNLESGDIWYNISSKEVKIHANNVTKVLSDHPSLSTIKIDDFDSYSLNSSSPGPWSKQGGKAYVDDTHSYSGSKSYHIRTGANPVAEVSGTGGQYTDTFQFLYYETTDNYSTMYGFYNSEGELLFSVGTSNPQLRLNDADGNREITGPIADPYYQEWRKWEIDIDWANREASLTWTDLTGNTAESPYTTTAKFKSTTVDDLAKVAIAGDGNTDSDLVWVDDITILD